MARHVEAMVGFLDRGAEVFDYGNSIRGEAKLAGYNRAFDFPGFVPAYIRPLFCEGKGPFRWVALSGDPADIARTDKAVLDLFPDNSSLRRWITLAQERVHYQGLPARICWLGYGERDRAGLAFNDLVASGAISAPIVIGRDHLDCGSVASPYRETEAMADGSDAIADWPLLNALVNTAAGASWVSIHHGGGVGIGYSQHAGMVVVADGTPLAAQKLERVLTTDPAMGVLRHVDAGYERAIEVAKNILILNKLLHEINQIDVARREIDHERLTAIAVSAQRHTLESRHLRLSEDELHGVQERLVLLDEFTLILGFGLAKLSEQAQVLPVIRMRLRIGGLDGQRGLRLTVLLIQLIHALAIHEVRLPNCRSLRFGNFSCRDRGCRLRSCC
jgi:hypothetical protein